jgi:hypothetical protein
VQLQLSPSERALLQPKTTSATNGPTDQQTNDNQQPQHPPPLSFIVRLAQKERQKHKSNTKTKNERSPKLM